MWISKFSMTLQMTVIAESSMSSHVQNQHIMLLFNLLGPYNQFCQLASSTVPQRSLLTNSNIALNFQTLNGAIEV